MEERERREREGERGRKKEEGDRINRHSIATQREKGLGVW